MTVCPNGSCSFPVELNYISTVLMEHQITLWAFLSCICSWQKMRCDNEQGFHKQCFFFFRAWNNCTWHLTLSMNSLHWALCGPDWAPLWPRALTDALAWLGPIPGCRLVMYAGIVLDHNTRQTVCRLNTAACFTYPDIMSICLLTSEVSRGGSRGVLTVQMSKSFAIAEVKWWLCCEGKALQKPKRVRANKH